MNQDQLLDQMSRAARYLAGNDPDRASTVNNVGYSSYDGDFGHSLAERDPSSWTLRMMVAARSLLYKYRKQLASAGIDAEAWPEVDESLETVVRTDHGILKFAPTVNVWLDADSTHLKFTARRDSSAISKGVIRIRFQYDPTIVRSIKEMVPGRAWNPGLKEWNAPPTPDAIKAAVEFANAHSLSVDPALVSMALEFKDLPQRRIVRDPEGHFEIHFPWDEKLGTAVRALPGREWNGAFWTVPSEPTVLEALVAFAKRYDFDIEPGLEDEAREAMASLEESVAASKSESGLIEIPNFGQGDDKPYPFQLGGIEYALGRAAAGGVLIADEMGLGKTITALGAIAAQNAFPAVIICPASLKENWRRETQRWLPGRSVVTLKGSKVMDLSLLNAHVYIVNYDILDRRKRHYKTTPLGRQGTLIDPDDRNAWVCSLAAEAPHAIVFDESHYCFPYESPVVTDRGVLQIGDVVERGLGNCVLSLGLAGWEWREIKNRWRNVSHRRLVRICHAEGDIICTEDHKVWTCEKGYVPASEIPYGAHLRVVQGTVLDPEERQVYGPNMLAPLRWPATIFRPASPYRSVASESRSRSESRLRTLPSFISRSASKFTQSFLRLFVRGHMANEPAGQTRTVATGSTADGRIQPGTQAPRRLSENEADECRSEVSSEGGCSEPQTTRPDMARKAWRTRPDDRATEAVSRVIRAFRSFGICSQDISRERPFRLLAELVRGRYSSAGTEASDRGRWLNPQDQEVEVPRRAQGVRSIRSRVDRVEILERGDTDRLVGMHGEGSTVYDLEVEGNHNYVADGVLVSNCKNGQARRTKACRELAKCNSAELVLLLTGTPVMNRPVELVSQLQIMGRLEAFGGWRKFTSRYCQAFQGRFGYNTDGAANLLELNTKLRDACMIRRLKADVLTELPPKIRSRIVLPLTNRAEYNAAEADVIRWIGAQATLNTEKRAEFRQEALTEWDEDRCFRATESAKGAVKIDPARPLIRFEIERSGITRKRYVAARARGLLASYRDLKEQRAKQAEQLVRIEALKQIAVRGMMPAALAWIADFLETGEALVAFASHVDIVREVAKSFEGSGMIYGATKLEDRTAAVDAFQAGRSKLIVGNLQAMGVGYTLTAASNVAFLELGWNPAAHDQPEDRCHRIGQEDSVTAYYLLPEGTIYEEIEQLIADKRKVVEAATDGTAAEAAKTSVLSDLVATLRKKGGD